jgi:hypothetical protein
MTHLYAVLLAAGILYAVPIIANPLCRCLNQRAAVLPSTSRRSRTASGRISPRRETEGMQTRKR